MNQKIKIQTKDWKDGYDIGFEAGKMYIRSLVERGEKHGWKCECGANNSRVFIKCPKCKKFRN